MRTDQIPKAILGGLLAIFLTVFIFFCLLIGGCTKRVYVPMESVRTEYRQADTTGLYSRIAKLFESRKEKEIKSDSFVDRTKELVVLNEKGDTTKHIKDHYIHLSSKERTELERVIAQKDSTIRELETKLSAVKTDSIPVPYPVEKKLSKWEQTKMELGGIAMGAVIALAIALCVAVVWLIKKGRR